MINELDAFKALCRTNLNAFTAKAFSILEPASTYKHNWHIECISEHLQAVYDNEIQYLIINMPPRSLKTHITSTAFPAYALGLNPSLRFILTSYRASLAEKMTRNTRLLMKNGFYQELFENTRISPDLDRQYYFETTERGQYYSSAMSSVTGEGCDIQICDDPINPMEASSPQSRMMANETIRSTLFSRFNDPKTGRFILVMQRLHDDDPTGNLLREEGWHHLKLPAEAKDKDHFIDLGKKRWVLKKGDLLFPERFDRKYLDKQRVRLGEYNYAGQYDQEPVPVGGGEFKDTWVKYYDPLKLDARGMNVFILVDPAGGEETNKKKKKTSDWTAMMVVGLSSDNNYYLLDIIRDRLNPTERIETLMILHRHWNAKLGKPPKVGYEKYGLMTDTHYLKKKMDEDNYRFSLIELGGSMNKEDRIRKLIPDLQTNRWYFPTEHLYVDCENRKFDLVSEIVKGEMISFPRARYDDMLDALSRIYEDDLEARFPALVSPKTNNNTGHDYESPYDF